MKPIPVNSIALGVLGAVAILMVSSVLAGKPLPLISSDRATFVVLLIVGMTMCALGPLRKIQPGRWTDPMNVVAIALGGLALLIALVLFSLRGRLPFVSERTATLALAAIMLVKVVLATVHHAWLDRIGG